MTPSVPPSRDEEATTVPTFRKPPSPRYPDAPPRNALERMLKMRDDERAESSRVR